MKPEKKKNEKRIFTVDMLRHQPGLIVKTHIKGGQARKKKDTT